MWYGLSQNAARNIGKAQQLATALAESQTAQQELVGARVQIADLTAKLKNLEIEHEVLLERKKRLDEDIVALQQQVSRLCIQAKLCFQLNVTLDSCR